MARNVETCFNYCGVSPVDIAFFSSDEQKWINRIHKLKEQHPDEVTIIRQPEVNDGCIYCKLPTSWLRIAPPRKIDMTDERRAEFAARMRTMNARKSNPLSDPEDLSEED